MGVNKVDVHRFIFANKKPTIESAESEWPGAYRYTPGLVLYYHTPTWIWLPHGKSKFLKRTSGKQGRCYPPLQVQLQLQSAST